MYLLEATRQVVSCVIKSFILVREPNTKKDAKRQSPIRLRNNTGCTYVLQAACWCIHCSNTLVSCSVTLMNSSDVRGAGTRGQTIKDGDEMFLWLPGHSVEQIKPFEVVSPSAKVPRVSVVLCA